MHLTDRWRRGLWQVAAALAAASLSSSLLAAPADAGTAATNVIRGTIVLPDGTPASGAVVTLWAVAEQVPDTRQERPFARLTTGADGVFSTSIEDLAPTFLAAALANNGAFNYEVDAAFTAAAVPGGSVPDVGAQYLLTDVSYLTLVGADLSGVLDKTGASPDFAAPSVDPTYVLAPADGVGTEAGTGLAGNGCGYVKSTTVLGRANYMEPVGELHAYYDATATFWYGSTANSDIGVGFKYGSGPWQVSTGASHLGQSGSQVYIKVGPYKGRTVRTQFGFRKERIDVLDYDYAVCRVEYRVVPERWQGGGIGLDRDVSSGDSGGQFDAARSKGYYLEFDARSGWRKYQGKSNKYTWDVTAYGVTLHATSGWGSNVDITWDFGNGTAKHDLYNVNARPIDATIVYSY